MQFWPFYLRQHAKRETRLLHYVGSTAALTVAGASLAAGKYKVLPLVLLAGGQERQTLCLANRLHLHAAIPAVSTALFDVPHPHIGQLNMVGATDTC